MKLPCVPWRWHGFGEVKRFPQLQVCVMQSRSQAPGLRAILPAPEEIQRWHYSTHNGPHFLLWPLARGLLRNVAENVNVGGGGSFCISVVNQPGRQGDLRCIKITLRYLPVYSPAGSWSRLLLVNGLLADLAVMIFAFHSTSHFHI